jgi:PAS domain-containing protein
MERSSGHGHKWSSEQAAELFQAMVDCLDQNRHVYFLSVDSGGHIIGCNHAMAHLLGLSSDEFQAESICNKLTESDAARLNERLSTAVVTNGQEAEAVVFESERCVPGIGDVFASQTNAEDDPGRASRCAARKRANAGFPVR